MPVIFGQLLAIWLGWKIAQKAALVAVIITLGTTLSGISGMLADAAHGYAGMLGDEVYSILCLLGAWEALDVVLLAGQWAFWWWAVGAFFKLRG